MKSAYNFICLRLTRNSVKCRVCVQPSTRTLIYHPPTLRSKTRAFCIIPEFSLTIGILLEWYSRRIHIFNITRVRDEEREIEKKTHIE
jgi:hypothetical protein